MKPIRFFNLVGMAGVASHENATARRWARYFDVALLPVACLALLAWYDNNHGQLLISPSWHVLIDWFVWGFFLTETMVLLCLTRQPGQYLLHNWFNLVLIIGTLPFVWNQQELGMLRAIRFLLIALKLAQLSRTLRMLLSRNNLGFTILACWLFAFGSGVMIAAIDPAINSIWDGIWWAWVTVTTVGYGDVVPTSGAGRLLAGVLMLIGMGLFSIFTAHFSAFLVSQEEEKIAETEQLVLDKEAEVLRGEQRILHALKEIDQRLQSLEDKIDQDRRP